MVPWSRFSMTPITTRVLLVSASLRAGLATISLILSYLSSPKAMGIFRATAMGILLAPITEIVSSVTWPRKLLTMLTNLQLGKIMERLLL